MNTRRFSIHVAGALRVHRLVLILSLIILLFTLAPTVFAATLYRLPYTSGTSQTVTQGWGGSYTHTGYMYYAYDFGMSESTTVRASRGGTVAYIKENSNVCGGSEYANYGNYVVINHGDNKATLYLHLKYNGAWVSTGQNVTGGDAIGASGKTGWSNCNAHLHFQRQNQGGWFKQSVSIYFDEIPDANEPLQTGQSYTSQNPQ